MIWTGDVNKQQGYWVKGSDKKNLNKLIEHGCQPQLIIIKMVLFHYRNREGSIVSRNDVSKPFNRSGGDCKEEVFLYVFKNINDEKFEKHQIIPTTINDTFRIEKADI